MTPLLQTKLFRPAPPRGWMARARLEQRLAEAAPLTLISAPPGFGKTSLVAAWLERTGAPAAWLALEPQDDEPTQFARYLIAALQTVQPTLGALGLGLLTSGAPVDPATILRLLINDLAEWGQPLTLVLDDYHSIAQEAIHAALVVLVEHAPPSVRIIITTRHDPPLPLGRWRVRRRLNELRADDLRCTSAEAAEFLREVMQAELPPASIEILEQRTEGWLAGLQLAALSLRGQAQPLLEAFSGSDRLIADYLVEEVLRQQSPTTRLFLLTTAICQRFSAALCAALQAELPGLEGLQGLDCQQQIELLERANIFMVPLDNQRNWYRYHHLFGELLRTHLQRQHPELGPILHERASRWFEQAGLLDEAMQYALAIQSPARAMQLLEQHGLFLLGNGFMGQLLGWIAQIPEAALQTSAWACCLCSWALVVSQQPQRAASFVQAAALQAAHMQPIWLEREGFSVGQTELAVQLLALRASIAQARGALEEALALAQQAEAQLPAQITWLHASLAFLIGTIYSQRGELSAARAALQRAASFASACGNKHLAITARSMQGTVLTDIGALDEAVAIYQQALEVSRHPHSGALLPPAVYPLVNLAWIHYRWNQLAEAEAFLTQAETVGVQGGLHDMQLWTLLLHARKASYSGQHAQAEQWIAQASALLDAHAALQPLAFNLGIARAQLALARQQPQRAAAALQQCGVAATAYRDQPPQAASSYLFFTQQQTLYPLVAQVLIAQQAWAEAGALIDWLAAAATHFQHVVVATQAAILAALAAHGQGLARQAQAAVERGLALSAPRGLLRVWLEYAPACGPVLLAALPHTAHGAFVQKLLAAPELDRAQPPASGLREPLTERETQILRLLATGLTSTEIAAQLVIAPSTVRSYIKNLYGKLEVNRRQHAIERGRELGLL